MFIYDDVHNLGSGAWVVESPGIHNLHMDLEIRGITNSTGLDELKPILPSLIRYQCNSELFSMSDQKCSSLDTKDTGSDSGDGEGITIERNCTFEAIEEFYIREQAFIAKTFAYNHKIEVRC